MLPLRLAKFWRLASILLLTVVLIGTLMPMVWFWDDRVGGLHWIENIDKWVHGLTFLFLALWFAGMYRRNNYWMIGLGLFLFGLLIEGCQYLVSYRTADWVDVGADTIGVFVGLMISLAGLGGWCQWLENLWPGPTAGNSID